MISTASSPTLSSPELSSGSSSLSDGELPVYRTHQSMKQMAEGRNLQKTISFVEINKREQSFSKKRDFATFMGKDVSSFPAVHKEDGYIFGSGRTSGPIPMTDEEIDDDDEDLKLKRKAQNRAAQRAFRERKERYVKELEKKVRYVQDSHVYATTQLFQENQFLRSIIHHLELENNALRGDTSDASMPGPSWLATVGPPVSLPLINAFPPTPLAPLKIRPALPILENKPKKTVSDKPTKKKKYQQLIKEMDKSEKQIDAKFPEENTVQDNSMSSTIPIPSSVMYTTETPSQQFTFSITTPATLRASSDSEHLCKKEQVQAVPLYPDHSHPANCLLAQSKPKNDHCSTAIPSPHTDSSSSIANIGGGEEGCASPSATKSSESTCISKSNSHEFDDLLLFDDDDEDTKSLQGLLKSIVNENMTCSTTTTTAAVTTGANHEHCLI